MLRRSAFYGWGSEAWCELRRALTRDPREAIRKMQDIIADRRIRHAGCAVAALDSCSWGYEADRLAEDGRFLADLEEAFLAPADVLASELGSAFQEACDRVFYAPDAARSAGLRQCAAGRALSRWSLSRKSRDLLLQKAREIEP